MTMPEQSELDFTGSGMTEVQSRIVETDLQSPPSGMSGIPGLDYFPSFLSEERQKLIMECIDSAPWMTDLTRRVQHYGWRYDYSSRFVTEDMKADPLPAALSDVAEKLRQRGWFERTPDQVIVNEYEPGQGIAPHVDRNCFGPAVATLSLGDDWPMEFTPVGGNDRRANRVELVLAVGSILVLRGDARSRWTHGIAKRKTDGRGRDSRRRRRRVSVTFRTLMR